MKRIATLTALTAMAALTAGTASAELLSNGGFEAGTGTDADSWNQIGANNVNGFNERSSGMPNSGSQALHLFYDNTQSPAGLNLAALQATAAGTVDNSLNYNFSVDVKVDNTNFVGLGLFYKILWLDQDGSDGGGVKGEQLISLIAEGVSTSYQTFTLDDIDAADGSDSVQIELIAAPGAVADIVNGAWFDNASLTVVPEPSSLALVGLGGLALMRRRRTA